MVLNDATEWTIFEIPRNDSSFILTRNLPVARRAFRADTQGVVDSVTGEELRAADTVFPGEALDIVVVMEDAGIDIAHARQIDSPAVARIDDDMRILWRVHILENDSRAGVVAAHIEEALLWMLGDIAADDFDMMTGYRGERTG